MLHALLSSVLLLACVSLRLYAVRPRQKPPKGNARSRSEPCAFAVFLGSGGHTSEALALVSALDFDRYCPRTYIVSEGDVLSAKKAIGLESDKASGSPPHNAAYSIITVPRARRVHQTLLTTPLSAAWSLTGCVYHIMLAPILRGRPFADVLLLNGPGTCVVLCLAVYLTKFLGLRAPKVIYVESFARVNKLSLSGKLLEYLVDSFIVQWPDLANNQPRVRYSGWLV